MLRIVNVCSHVVMVGKFCQWRHLIPKPISPAVITALTLGGNNIYIRRENSLEKYCRFADIRKGNKDTVNLVFIIICETTRMQT